MSRAPRSLLLIALASFLFASAPERARADEAPKIRSVTPATAFRGQTVDVVIEGSGLFPVDEVTTTRADVGIQVQNASTSFKLMLRVTIQDTATPGSVPITIRTKIGTAKTEKLQVKLRTPVVNKVKPDVLRRGGEYDLTVEGLRLLMPGADSKVTVDAPMTAKKTKGSEAQMTVHVVVPPTTPPGTKTLTVETADGKASGSFTVTLSPPSVKEVMPATIARGSRMEVTIKGKSLLSTTPVVLGVPDPTVVVTARGERTSDVLPLSVAVAKEAAPGPRLLVVSTPDGTVGVTITVTIPRVTLTGMSPNGAARGTSTQISLAGSELGTAPALRFVPADPAVTVEPAAPPIPARVTVAATAMLGPRTLLAQTPDGVAATIFTVNARTPSITGIAPADVAPGATTDVAVDGKNMEGVTFRLLTPDPEVSVVAGDGEGKLKIEVKPDAKPGPRALYARTSEGATVAHFLVRGNAPGAPLVSTVLPLRVSRGAAGEVTVQGMNLRARGDKPPAITVTADDGSAIPFEIASSTGTDLKLKLTPPAKTPIGPLAIGVVTPDGATGCCVHVVPAPPAIRTATPDRVTRPADVSIAVAGSNLVAPDGTKPTVALTKPDGSGGLPVELAASAPDALTLKVTVAAGTPPGPYVLTVVTAEGAAAVPIPVDASLPAIDTMMPALIGVPTSLEATIEGKNLVQPDGKVPEVTVTRVGSSASVKAQVLEANAAALKVRVVTPPGTQPGPHLLVVKTVDGSAAFLFTVTDAPPPRIESIDNGVGLRLGTTRTVIRGSGLAGVTDVVVSGKGVTATVLSGGTDRDLLVQFQVAGEAEPGVRTVTVIGPGGAATHDKVTFTVK